MATLDIEQLQRLAREALQLAKELDLHSIERRAYLRLAESCSCVAAIIQNKERQRDERNNQGSK
jgi:hypothetical protein